MGRWMLDDLAVVRGSRRIGARVAHANAGTLLLVCSYIDALAAANAGRASETFRHHRVSPQAEFVAFINEYMHGFRQAAERRPGFFHQRSVIVDRCAPGCDPKGKAQRRKRLNYLEMLYTLYRNGVVHEFLPRGWGAFTRGRDRYLQWDGRRRRLIIKLDHFVRDFRRALRTYCRDVRTDPMKRQNFRRRLRFVVRH